MKKNHPKKQARKPASINLTQNLSLSKDQKHPGTESPGTPDPVTFTAVITATFTHTDPGDSTVTATHGVISKTIEKTDTIRFDNVQIGEIIMMQGKSLGSSDFTINVKASPASQQLGPGRINFNFIIINNE